MIETDAILQHLHIERAAPTAPYLSAILAAWSERIPWESASRIARHKTPAAPYQYARTPDRFYDDALNRGLGGTCFESNTALKALLDDLGYQSTYALCDMAHSSTADPHCALITTIDGVRYIADAGWPLPTAIPLSESESTTGSVPVYDYFIEPSGAGRWRVWRKSGDFEQDCFTLKAASVPPDTFRARLIRDHFEDGLFLNNVIIHRVIDNRVLRFDQTKGLIERVPGAERDIPWTDEQAADVPAAVAHLFVMDESIVRQALDS
jgi:arylamine N-acetyltransferase